MLNDGNDENDENDEIDEIDGRKDEDENDEDGGIGEDDVLFRNGRIVTLSDGQAVVNGLAGVDKEDEEGLDFGVGGVEEEGEDPEVMLSIQLDIVVWLRAEG